MHGRKRQQIEDWTLDTVEIALLWQRLYYAASMRYGKYPQTHLANPVTFFCPN